MTSVTRGTGAGATVANPDGGSQAVWSNTSLITADEGYYATLQLSHVYGETGYNYLKASDFGFFGLNCLINFAQIIRAARILAISIK